MTYRTYNIDKQFATEHSIGFKNLIVSGCSFTYNNSADTACSWPVYLRDLGGFNRLLDTSLPGAGNNHIARSLQWCIETSDVTPEDSLVVVMWSGNDRDDSIISSEFIKPNYLRGDVFYNYTDSVSSAVTGGAQGESNVKLNFFKDLNFIKSHQSRAVENYLLVSGTWHYLNSLGYKFIFLDYLDRSLPNRSDDFDIRLFLPKTLRGRYDSMFVDIANIYAWCLKHQYLSSDDFHPTPDGHLDWTRQVLIPALLKL